MNYLIVPTDGLRKKLSGFGWVMSATWLSCVYVTTELCQNTEKESPLLTRYDVGYERVSVIDQIWLRLWKSLCYWPNMTSLWHKRKLPTYKSPKSNPKLENSNFWFQIWSSISSYFSSPNSPSIAKEMSSNSENLISSTQSVSRWGRLVIIEVSLRIRHGHLYIDVSKEPWKTILPLSYA